MEFFFTRHAIQRIYERSINKSNIKQAVINGEIIKEYPEDKPCPSRLLLYIVDNKPLHVVCSIESEDLQNRVIIITVYEPSLEEWNEDFRTRRKEK